MFYSKIYRKKSDVLLAVCDQKVHDKAFEDGGLNFYVDPDFYGKNGTSEKELLSLFEEADIINLAGCACVDLAIKAGIVDPENILEFGGFKHAQVVRL
jgi:hypothetical protein